MGVVSVNDAPTLWLRLLNLSNYIPHPSHINKVFEDLLLWWMGMGIRTVTTKSVAPDLGELAFLGDVKLFKQCHYTLFEAIDPFKLNPTSTLHKYKYKVFEHFLLWSCGG